jgi:Contractile injection system tube protein
MTTQVRKAIIRVEWQDPDRKPKEIPVQYNPTEYTLDKQVTLGEVTIPGIDAPVQQFVRGNAEKMTLDLFFDTTDHGMGPGATSVTTRTDQIYQLIKIEPKRHAPPILTFHWNDQFPGSSVGAAPDDIAGAPAKIVTSAPEGAPSSAVDTAVSATGSTGATAVASPHDSSANQRVNGFRCILESIRQKFTLFSSDGVPLRATLTVTLREYKTLNDQLERLGLSSPDRTHAHILSQTDSLSSVANRYYDRPGIWRPIADNNAITDPRRLTAGRILEIPPLN